MEAHDMKNNGKELAGCYDSICNNDSNFTAIEIVGSVFQVIQDVAYPVNETGGCNPQHF